MCLLMSKHTQQCRTVKQIITNWEDLFTDQRTFTEWWTLFAGIPLGWYSVPVLRIDSVPVLELLVIWMVSACVCYSCECSIIIIILQVRWITVELLLLFVISRFLDTHLWIYILDKWIYYSFLNKIVKILWASSLI